ncbi:MAG: class I SAM-dependent methyltransferase [Candidatus Methanoplasma sp.]|jgi:cyclopropane fatty-acyl-phospholipid synthase-like methyltransferase|nr:class I SAM-dependent methyltransferase [Candidatus Methanoplasma sp.]
MPEKDDDKECWERFYAEQRRPWRGVGKLGPLKVAPGSKALDLGCGNGKTAAALLEAGAVVTGIDISENAVAQCVKAFGEKAVFIAADCTELPFEDGSFDIVAAVHVFEHLGEEKAALAVKEIKRALAPGGLLLLRSFSVCDSRAGGRSEDVRGNGIRYRYFTKELIAEMFDGFEAVSVERIDETMRFGAVRVRIECLFRNGRGPL